MSGREMDGEADAFALTGGPRLQSLPISVMEVNLWTQGKVREEDRMKRTPELRTLSEDHHHGLVHARRLRRVQKGQEANSAKSAAKEFLDFWQKETSIHFRKEEEVLLPVVARYGGDVSQDSLVEMLAQHAYIRALIMRLSDEVMGGNVRTETLHEIGEQLEAHIRL